MKESKIVKNEVVKVGKKILIIIDVQHDFIDGVLGNDMTKGVLSKIVKKLKEHGAEYDSIYLTRDIHFNNYLDTLEGKKLPVPHCIKKVEEKLFMKNFGRLLKNSVNKKNMLV